VARTTRSGSDAGDTWLSIQAVARRTGLSEYTLRYYEQIGLITAIPRDRSSGHRRYPMRIVEKIESLARLRAAGLSIEGMRTLMSSSGHGTDGIEVKITQLVAHRDGVTEQIAALEARRRYLDNRIAFWRAEQAGDHAEAARLAREGDRLVEHLT
jgi:MerR family transcriptional regulator, aldehyde-responsive regulator